MKYILTNKNYEKLYILINDGFTAVGFVNYDMRMDGTPYRDVCKIRMFQHGDVDFGSRGISYGGLFAKNNTKEDFIKECEDLSLEWFEPISEQNDAECDATKPN